MSVINNKMSVNNKRSNPYINTENDDDMPARKQRINITGQFKPKKISPKSIIGPKIIVKSPKNIESPFSIKSIDSSPDIEFDHIEYSSELTVSSEKNSPEKSFLENNNISFKFATLFCSKYEILHYLDNLITEFANSTEDHIKFTLEIAEIDINELEKSKKLTPIEIYNIINEYIKILC